MRPRFESTTAAMMPRGDHGYSFVELLISMLLLTLILGGLSTALFQGQATYDAQARAAELRQTGRVAIDELAVEIRMTGADIGNVPQALTAAGPYNIQFAADIDNDSNAPPCGAAFETATDGGAERLTYTLAGGTLSRQLDCWDGVNWTNEYANQGIADNLINATVARPLFRYFDEDGVELVPGAGGLTSAERDDVRAIEVTLVLDDGVQHALADSIVDFEITTQVKLRNAGLQ